MGFKIFGVVVVIQLFAFFDGTERKNIDALVLELHFAVWGARMVDEPSFVGRDIPIDHRF